MSQMAKHILTQLQDTDLMDFPGFKIQAAHKGKKVLNLSHGKTYLYYDIASLTKIVFTTTWYIDAVANKKISLEDKVNDILPWYPHSRVKVGQLLNHSAGNQWWAPYYKTVDLKLSPEEVYQQMEREWRKAPLSRSKKAVYSDLDFYLLGSIMQKVELKPLRLIWEAIKNQYFQNTSFHFNYGNKSSFKKSQYAPTENCPWRKKIIQGQVHDENGWAMGGVAPQAGLFATIDDLYQFGEGLRLSHFGKRGHLYDKKTLQTFRQRSVPQSRGYWGYGFMLPSSQGSSAGDHFSPESYGHTGFTGVSFWFDPKRDLYVCLLSNRIHPSREQSGFVKLRPLLHNWIVESIEKR